MNTELLKVGLESQHNVPLSPQAQAATTLNDNEMGVPNDDDTSSFKGIAIKLINKKKERRRNKYVENDSNYEST